MHRRKVQAVCETILNAQALKLSIGLRHPFLENANRTIPINYVVLSHRHRTPPNDTLVNILGASPDDTIRTGEVSTRYRPISSMLMLSVFQPFFELVRCVVLSNSSARQGDMGRAACMESVLVVGQRRGAVFRLSWILNSGRYTLEWR